MELAIPAAESRVSDTLHTILTRPREIVGKPPTAKGKPRVQQIPSHQLSLFLFLSDIALHDEREGQHDGTHDDEEDVDGHVGQQHLVRHPSFFFPLSFFPRGLPSGSSYFSLPRAGSPISFRLFNPERRPASVVSFPTGRCSSRVVRERGGEGKNAARTTSKSNTGKRLFLFFF